MKSSLPDAFPLQWPAGWPRTNAGQRRDSRYHVSETKARDELLAAVHRLGGRVAIISTNLPTRRDGIPYVGHSADDPGVAVYWVRGVRQEVMACDRWRKPWENMRAIFHAVEGLLAMERAGATQIMERAFSAFQLPAGGAPAPWREILGYDVHTREDASKAFKALALKLHPDAGGDIEKFKEAEAAYRVALQALEA